MEAWGRVIDRGAALEARQAFEALLSFCQEHDGTFWEAEKSLLSRVFALGCILVRLLLVSRHRRLNLEPYLAFQFTSRRE